MRGLRRCAAATSVAGALALAGVSWLLATEHGTAWLLHQIAARVEGSELDAVEGTLVHGLTLRGVRFGVAEASDAKTAATAASGSLHVRVDQLTLVPDITSILHGTVYIESLYVRGARVRLGAAGDASAARLEAAEQPAVDALLPPAPPLDVVLAEVVAEDVSIHRPQRAPVSLARIALSGRWDRRRLVLDPLELEAPQARVALSAQVATTAARERTASWDLRASADGLDPDLWLPDSWLDGAWLAATAPDALRPTDAAGSMGADGYVNASITSSGRWTPSATSGELLLDSIDGRWRGRSLRGTAHLRLTREQVARGRIDLRVGDTSLQLEGDVHLRDRVSGEVELAARNLAFGDIELASVVVHASGRAAEHAVRLHVRGSPVSAELELDGAWSSAGWHGDVQVSELELEDAVRLSAGAPAAVSIGRAGSVDLERTCWRAAALAEPSSGSLPPLTHFCVAGARSETGGVALSASVARTPFSFLRAVSNPVVPGLVPAGIEGSVEAELELHSSGRADWTRPGSWRGRLKLRSAGAQAERSSDSPEADLDRILLYESLELSAELDDGSAVASATAKLMDGGSLDAELRVSDIDSAAASLDGALAVHVPSLRPLEPLLPDIGAAAGRLVADLTFDGSLKRPRVRGEVAATDVAFDVPALGIRLTRGQLRVHPPDDTRVGAAFELQGSVYSQPASETPSGVAAPAFGRDPRRDTGQLVFDGTWTEREGLVVELAGEDFLAADLPGANARLTTDLRFTLSEQAAALTGRVRIPRANVDLSKLPQATPSRVSPDVVVVDRPRRDPEPEVLPLRTRVAVVFGDEVHVEGFGLDVELAGRLLVRESPGAPTTASGEILANGQYRAYGQELEIDGGRILYAGTPIDNPRLNLRAVRRVEEVTAGLHITGSARDPRLEVFSEPAMSQGDALAYLVTGSPLSQAGSQLEQGDALAAAARSLGATAGSPLLKRLGSQLGIDEVGIERSDMLGGDVLALGQYLSPRLYVGYGVGLFEPGDVITMRYRLSDVLSLRVLRAEDETRAGIELRFER